MSFEDLFDGEGNAREEANEPIEEMSWDTGMVWSTGRLPSDVWVED